MPDHNQLELLDAQNHAAYILSDPLEIMAVLNGLIQQRSMVSAHPEGSSSFALTTLLAIDAGTRTLTFDQGSDESSNRRLLAASGVTFSALLERIRVQFSCGPLATGQFQGYAALTTAFPQHLLRLQRREYFRLITPITHSVTCNIPVEIEEGRLQTFEARVLDISGGGVGVMVPPRGLAMSTGMEFEACSMLLPEFGVINARLRIRNVFQVTNRNGVSMTRAGCQFADLPRGAESLIQRYILRIERERGARVRGA